MTTKAQVNKTVNAACSLRRRGVWRYTKMQASVVEMRAISVAPAIASRRGDGSGLEYNGRARTRMALVLATAATVDAIKRIFQRTSMRALQQFCELLLVFSGARD